VIKFLRGLFFGIDKKDPVYYCDVYKKKGCSHVDGFLCNMDTCNILEQYNNEQINCPVCGYYCLGNGGLGCIDKPKLCGYDL